MCINLKEQNIQHESKTDLQLLIQSLHALAINLFKKYIWMNPINQFCRASQMLVFFFLSDLTC